ncbi:glycosyl transferase family group 2-domain-containing protein [Tricladium varicosporioides]|nr:glycosyl transferase family group 2-domain-containing protein [Hymenoscyphus varicosporioides]
MSYSKIPAWCVQRVTSLVFLSLIVLLYVAIWHDRPQAQHHGKAPLKLPKAGEKVDDSIPLTNAQLLFICYTLAAHFLGLTFPMRLVYATRSITKKLKNELRQLPITSNVLSNLPETPSKFLESSYGHEGYESSSSSYTDESRTQVDENDDLILHTIIIPNYKEDIETLRETLEVLACHPQACSVYEIILAMEMGEAGAKVKAGALIKEFSDQFRDIEYTLHPNDIPGEAQGKSSNLCWASKHVNGKYLDGHMKRNVIVTKVFTKRVYTNFLVLAADSHLAAKYFSLINGMHFRYPQTAETTMYVPPIIFDRNAHLVPTPVRVADLMWAGAGLSGHYDTSSICPPTSVYSLPLCLVDHAGGWDAGDDSIGEDLHMYIKCFFSLNGNLTTRTILSPASCSNVSTGAKGIRGFFKDIKARYRQALRHMWGSLDSGYVARLVPQMWWHPREEQGVERPNWGKTLILLHRMYEAHFLPVHITLLIIGGAFYTLLTPAHLTHPLLLQTLNLTAYMRIGSFLGFATFFYLYEAYHRVCVSAREEEMIKVGLAGKMEGAFSHRTRKNAADICLFPVVGILFGSLPTTVALVCHLWTLKLVYKVSKKPSWLPAGSPL